MARTSCCRPCCGWIRARWRGLASEASPGSERAALLGFLVRALLLALGRRLLLAPALGLVLTLGLGLGRLGLAARGLGRGLGLGLLLRLRLLAFLLGLLGLVLRAQELDDGHLRPVAAARAQAQDARVPARTRRVARAQVVEELR